VIKRATEMHRSYPNLVSVSNKYLAQKKFIKDQEDYKNNVNFFLIYSLL
jgi:hypothetical protein